jgi:hypothetical protein
VGTTMRVLSRWVREFAAGVHAGHAIRLGLPVSCAARRDGVVPDAVEPHGYAGSPTPAGTAAHPAPASPPRRRDHASPLHTAAATADPIHRRQVPTLRGGA